MQAPHVLLECRVFQTTHTMINTTRLFRFSLLTGLLCGASTASLLAQTPADQPPGGDHRHGPPSVLFDALDTNHDGVLSAEEIDNAPAVLKGLLKDGQTQLTRDDLRSGHEDGQTPPPWHRPSSDDQAADARPHDHRRFAWEDQETPSPWRHHFRHNEDEPRWERPMWAQHEQERMDDRQRPDFDREDGQRDEPRHPRCFEPRMDERDETVASRQTDEILGALHRLEREVHQLKEAQEKPAAPAAPAAH